MSTLPIRVPERLTTPEGGLIFEFPLTLNRANTYQHFMQRHKTRTELWRVLDNRVTYKLLPRPPKRPWDRAHAVVELRTFRQMDGDNAEARLKNIWDWLVSRGYIVDDSPAHLTTSLRATTAPRHAIGVTVTLTEVTG